VNGYAYLKVVGDKFFPACRWLVWHYRNKHAPWKTDWGRAHESLLHFRNAKRFKFNQDAVRVAYNAHTLRYPQHTQATSSVFGAEKGGKSGHVWQPHPQGAKPKDVFEISVLNNGMEESTPHPTQKPEDLVRRLVLARTDPGDLVVDPFGGSGTTFVVAEKLERRWLGVDREPEYLGYAVERLKRTVPDEAANLSRYLAVAEASVSNREAVRVGKPARNGRRDAQTTLLSEDEIPEIVEE
jgi:site-specific DNA-methyltransferase (adenine-specific)